MMIHETFQIQIQHIYSEAHGQQNPILGNQTFRKALHLILMSQS